MNKQNIPMVDLTVQYENLRDEIRERWDKLSASASFILGEEVDRFEEEFASYCGRKYALGCSSGTSALHLALEVAGARSGEVISTPFTFIATSSAVIHSGGSIRWADIKEDTYCIDPVNITELISSNTKVLLPVHLYGASADMDKILSIAKEYGLKVIEDAAQSHGALYKGKESGSMGDMGCFSFYPGKNLGAFGEAGAVVCDDSETLEHLRRLRAHGSSVRYRHEEIGYNYRIDALQAAVLRIKLRHLDDWNNKRRNIAAIYKEGLSNLPVTIPYEADNTRHVYHQYVILSDKRDELAEFLKSEGVATAVHYPVPLHLQPCFSYLNHSRGSFPVSEKISDLCISLPIFPEMTDSQIEYVIKKVRAFYEG